jgi:hypothetical protein
MPTWKSAILANLAVQALTTLASEGNPYATDVRPPRDRAPIGDAMVGMTLPILGIHPALRVLGAMYGDRKLNLLNLPLRKIRHFASQGPIWLQLEITESLHKITRENDPVAEVLDR